MTRRTLVLPHVGWAVMWGSLLRLSRLGALELKMMLVGEGGAPSSGAWPTCALCFWSHLEGAGAEVRVGSGDSGYDLKQAGRAMEDLFKWSGPRAGEVAGQEGLQRHYRGLGPDLC